MTLDHDILRAALVGYQEELRKLEASIAAVKAKLGGAAAAPAASSARGGRRQMSAEARKRIAEAQKKRWAAYHKTQTAS